MGQNLIWLTTCILFVTLASCRPTDRNPLPVFTVVSTTFTDELQAEGTVESVNSLTVNCPKGAGGTIVFLVEDGTRVKEGDVVCRIEDPMLGTDYEDLLINLEQNRADLSKTYADHALELAILEAQIQNNEAQKAITGLDSLQLAFTPGNQRRIKELELQQSAIQNSRFEKKLKTLKIIQQSELRKQLRGIERVESRVKGMEERIASLTLRAPRSGLVVRGVNPVSNTKFIVGDNAWEGLPLVILPDMEQMKVKIMAPEGQFKRLKIGDKVEFSFDAQPDNLAWGTITKKSPVGQPIKRRSKVKVFDVEASVDSSRHIPTPGMSAQCRIILQQLSDTLVVPQIALFERDSVKVVYVETAKGYEVREVVAGLSSPSEVVITKGLKAGERISLLLPDDQLILKNKTKP
ncbi:MAG: efflux RND transporter periplasmic adaptor subunit [Paludibacter sp.]|nr:efflux RND transporter periplasmic adaptor subunit [Paludibacter sp.]